MAKNPAAVALGRRGGKATAKNRSAEERKDVARKAARARWDREKTKRSTSNPQSK